MNNVSSNMKGIVKMEIGTHEGIWGPIAHWPYRDTTWGQLLAFGPSIFPLNRSCSSPCGTIPY